MVDLTAMNLSLGNHTISVRANGNAINFLNSAFSPTVSFLVHQTLPAPTGISVNNNIATWNPVPGAVAYSVMVGSETRTTLSATFNIDILNLSPGMHSISVRAISAGNFIQSSAFSLPIDFAVYHTLATPAGLFVDNNLVASWASVSGAVSYTVSVGGIEQTVTSTWFDINTLNLPTGTHSISVRANSAGGFILNSPFSSPVSFVVQAPVAEGTDGLWFLILDDGYEQEFVVAIEIKNDIPTVHMCLFNNTLLITFDPTTGTLEYVAGLFIGPPVWILIEFDFVFVYDPLTDTWASYVYIDGEYEDIGVPLVRGEAYSPDGVWSLILSDGYEIDVAAVIEIEDGIPTVILCFFDNTVLIDFDEETNILTYITGFYIWASWANDWILISIGFQFMYNPATDTWAILHWEEMESEDFQILLVRGDLSEYSTGTLFTNLVNQMTQKYMQQYN
jgi:hypothetical protein